jgi:hypothetical protein
VSGFSFSFRKQFADRVERGEKLQTIRPRRKDGRMPKPGDKVSLFTGMRTAYCRRLGSSTVVEAFPVYLDLDELGARMIVINGMRLNFGEAEAFAKLDGFQNAREMIEWFRGTYPGAGAFNGFCVRWSSPMIGG